MHIIIIIITATSESMQNANRVGYDLKDWSRSRKAFMLL